MPPINKRVLLPPAVAKIYEAIEELKARYPGRPFTPDGHLVGSIGEVVAAEALGLTLYPPSHPGHDAYDADGDVQIKMTATAWRCTPPARVWSCSGSFPRKRPRSSTTDRVMSHGTRREIWARTASA